MARIAALLALCTLLPSCKTCTLTGCDASISLQLGSVEAPLANEHHYIELDFDDTSSIATCIPDRPCSFDPVLPITSRGEFHDGVISLDFGAGSAPPGAFDVRVTVAEDVLLEERIEPEYEERPRDGDEGCGTCSRTAEPIVRLADA